MSVFTKILLCNVYLKPDGCIFNNVTRDETYTQLHNLAITYVTVWFSYVNNRPIVCDSRLLHKVGGRKVLRSVESMVRLHRLSWRASSACCLSTRLLDGHQQVGHHSAMSPTSHRSYMRTPHRPQIVHSTCGTNFTIIIIIVTDCTF